MTLRSWPSCPGCNPDGWSALLDGLHVDQARAHVTDMVEAYLFEWAARKAPPSLTGRILAHVYATAASRRRARPALRRQIALCVARTQATLAETRRILDQSQALQKRRAILTAP